ncbi:hypothetical protein F4808DRAFT_360664 [Astrocystis sublimbata]|nr:hypothetical protein F4808DRAFT_360664 [Astrocystis sublimbata]
MKLPNLLSIILTALSLSSVASAWLKQKALEYDSPGCKNTIKHYWLGDKKRQIALDDATESVRTSTANDGIWRWYGFSASTDDGKECSGERVARVWGPCFDLDKYASEGKPDIKCLRICNMWAHENDSESCASFGVHE